MGFYSDQEQKQIISDNLSYQISLTGKDQKEIAIELDINPPTFNQWVNGKAIPNVSTLKRLADYFNVFLSDIVDRPSDKLADIKLNNTEQKVISRYRKAPQGTKEAINKLLDIEKED